MLPVVGLSCAAPLYHVVVQIIVVTATTGNPVFKDVVHESATAREKEEAAEDPI
ncbi:MAG: hypothetical protein ACC612_00095 [Methanomethylovorans sp.]|uniref:hypothetical protein n=1 Tax=Methanomethylovorans sp. TaxID=2758717 RepID=UPI003530F98B